jgi:hypothetical protein
MKTMKLATILGALEATELICALATQHNLSFVLDALIKATKREAEKNPNMGYDTYAADMQDISDRLKQEGY